MTEPQPGRRTAGGSPLIHVFSPMTSLSFAPGATSLRIGLISDTHGILRSAACAALAGCDCILHAGDIGAASVLLELERIAPVLAVRGNIDRGSWAAALPDTASLMAGGKRILLTHDIKRLPGSQIADRYQIVVSGHSHRACVSETAGVLYINPGSAGPRRFRLPVSLALLDIVNGHPSAAVHELPEEPPGRHTSAQKTKCP